MTLSRKILTTLAVLLAALPLTSASAYAGSISVDKTRQHLTADHARLKSGASTCGCFYVANVDGGHPWKRRHHK